MIVNFATFKNGDCCKLQLLYVFQINHMCYQCKKLFCVTTGAILQFSQIPMLRLFLWNMKVIFP